MRRRLAAGLTAAALLGGTLVSAAVSNAATSPRLATTLDVAIPGPFGGCDPGSPSTTAATDAVLALVLPSAFTPGAVGVPVGDTDVIAQAEVVGTTPQTVTYTIAPGVTWPSGRPLVAADLVRTWRERRDDRVLADLGYRDVASAVADPTGTSVTVTFRAPYSDWASLFDLIVPAPTATARCALPTAALDPSVGPYAIVSATAGRIVLEANPLWPNPPTFPRLVVTTDPGTAVPPGAAPRLAILPAPSLGALQALTSSGAYASTISHTTTVVSLDFAVRGRAALSLDARRGVAEMVDRTALVDQLAAPIDSTAAPGTSELFGQGEPSYLGPTGTGVVTPLPVGTVPVGSSGSRGAAAYGDAGSPSLGAAWLRAAHYTKGPDGWETPSRAAFRLCVAVPEHQPQLLALSAAVATQLRAHHVAVVVTPLAGASSVLAALRTGTCAAGVVVRTGDGYATHEAAAWLRPSRPVPVGLTWTGVNDPVVATSATTATAVLNPVTAATAWAVTDGRLWTLMVGLPLYSPSAYVGWTPSLQGVTTCETIAGCVSEATSLVLAPKP